MPAPSPPTGVVLQTGNGQNLVTWNAVAGATAYYVQRSTDNATWTTFGPISIPSYLDTAVLVGVAYYYQVASTNGTTSAYTAPTGGSPTSITPCLPGQINLGYLRYQAQLRSDKLNSQYLTLDEWNININSSRTALYDILTRKYGENYFMAPKLLITLTGLDFYPLPNGANYPINGVPSPALYKLLGVDANINGGTASNGPNVGWVPLPRFNWSDRDKYTVFPGQAGALNNFYQMAYRQMGQNLEVIPANQNQVLRLSYVPIDTQLLQDTDMLVYGFSGWWEWIINDAAKKAMIKEESLEKWQQLDNENAKIEMRIEETAESRDASQPNTVSNTRNTMGDAGFSGWGSNMGGGFFGGGGW